jgi:hypothetical protein
MATMKLNRFGLFWFPSKEPDLKPTVSLKMRDQHRSTAMT